MTETLCTCGKPTAGAWLCTRCETTLRHTLVNVAAHHADLDTVATRRTRYGDPSGGTGGIGHGQPIPVDMRFVNQRETETYLDHDGSAANSPGAQLATEAHATLVAWTRVVMDERPEFGGVACPPGCCLHTECSLIRRSRRPRDTVPSMCAYLARQYRWLLTQRWVPDLLDELLDLEHRLSRMVDAPATRWYAGKCGDTDETGNVCGAELYASERQTTMDCPGCSRRYDVHARREALLEYAEDFLVTASEAVAALIEWGDHVGKRETLDKRIQRWGLAGRLEIRDVTSLRGRDRYLYRLGDIQALMLADARGRQTRRIGA